MNKKTISKIREFNRFYTSIIGVTNNHILESEYSLTEVRIMFELANTPEINARQLITILRVNEGYISRVLSKLSRQNIIRKKQHKDDKRHFALELSEKGKKIFSELNKRSDNEIAILLKNLTPGENKLLLQSIEQIKKLLSKK